MLDNALEYGAVVTLRNFGSVFSTVNAKNQPAGFLTRLQIAVDFWAPMAINSVMASQYNWKDAGQTIGIIFLNADLGRAHTADESTYMVEYKKRGGDGLREFSRQRQTRKTRSDKGKSRQPLY